MPIRGTQYLVSGLGMEKGERPHHFFSPDHVLSCVGLHARTKLLAWSRLWSKHEMHAAELSDEVESEVQASAVRVREFRCESHRQILTGTYFFTFIWWHLRAIFKWVTCTFSPQLMLH